MTRIEWRRNLNAYLAVCDCGESNLTARLSQAEEWALTHHQGVTMTRPAKVDDLLGVWDAQGQFPLRDCDDVAAVFAYIHQLEADVRRLENYGDTLREDLAEARDLYDTRRAAHNDLDRRVRAAVVFIDRARAHLDDWRAGELVAALDILRGEATA